jgi:hypothetical protein
MEGEERRGIPVTEWMELESASVTSPAAWGVTSTKRSVVDSCLKFETTPLETSMSVCDTCVGCEKTIRKGTGNTDVLAPKSVSIVAR